MNHILTREDLKKCTLERVSPIVIALETPAGVTWVLTAYQDYVEVQVYSEKDVLFFTADIYSDKIDDLLEFIYANCIRL